MNDFRTRTLAGGLVMTVLCAAALSGAPWATGLLTREEALALAYPGADVTAERIFLTPEQQKQAADVAGSPIPSALIGRYTARKEQQVIGRAYVDTHTVRTKRETLLISLDAGGGVKRVDATAFLEPIEYLAPQAFLNQFNGRPLTDDLRMHRAIRPVAGATLTANAVTEAVRRVLAIDAVLR